MLLGDRKKFTAGQNCKIRLKNTIAERVLNVKY